MLSTDKKYKVLDLYHGSGRIWNKLKNDGIKFNLTPIDKKNGIDNLKIENLIDYQKYDIIDIDAYGDGIGHFLKIKNKLKNGAIVFITYINIMGSGCKTTMDMAGLGEAYKYCRHLTSNKEVALMAFKKIFCGITDNIFFISPTLKKYYIAFKIKIIGD